MHPISAMKQVGGSITFDRIGDVDVTKRRRTGSRPFHKRQLACESFSCLF
jgi:hypothetical protein